MELHTERIATPARPSATVVLLRDGSAGLEVFLMQRNDLSDVLGGAYVFPGGKVDRDDAEWGERLDLPPAVLQARLGETELAAEDACALHVAAIRELFEETGVLLAGLSAPAARQAWAALRTGQRFDDLMEASRFTLHASALAPWSRWITPLTGGVVRKRFDTRFLLARVPEGQVPGHDSHEATASTWLTPREALSRYWADEIALAPPQIMSLAHLARYADAAAAFEEALRRAPPLVQPEPVAESEGRALCYPGDPAHSNAVRALPGPTRLVWRGKRFEPADGLAALLAD